jgi:hypothetical protein
MRVLRPRWVVAEAMLAGVPSYSGILFVMQGDGALPRWGRLATTRNVRNNRPELVERMGKQLSGHVQAKPLNNSETVVSSDSAIRWRVRTPASLVPRSKSEI